MQNASRSRERCPNAPKGHRMLVVSLTARPSNGRTTLLQNSIQVKKRTLNINGL